MQICKFYGVEDNNYVKVSGVLYQMIKSVLEDPEMVKT
jgi:hypothetical protein